MAANKVAFYFDVVSPWSYVAFQVTRRYQKLWNLDVTWKPVNQGYLMKFSGNRPPIAVPNKGTWMWQDRERAVAFYGVTLNTPKGFPVNTSHCQTFLYTLSSHPSLTPTIFESAIETLFAAVWEHDYPVATREDLEKILEKAGYCGLKKEVVGEVLDKSMTKEARDEVQKVTKSCVEEKGMFGSPTLVVKRGKDGEEGMFWGSDRFEQLAAWLGVPYRGPFADGSVAKL